MTSLKLIRQERNLTQVELSKRARISLRTLQDYEQGKKDINVAAALTVYKLAVALSCNMEDLLEI